MKITIVVNQTTPWEASDYDKGLLNGSEEMVVEFSRELANRGHDVTVFSSLDIGYYIDGYFSKKNIVTYQNLKSLVNHPHEGILIAFKNPLALYLSGFSQKYLWTADSNKLNSRLMQMCDGLYGISLWHENELKELNYGYHLISHIEPGVNLSEESNKIKRIPKQCLYASSPDRGLDFLLEIWPEIKKVHPDATLITTYSKTNRRTNKEMNKLYQQSDILAYPCSGQERYCITAIKAQMYGTIPCVIPHMALQDTVQFGEKCLKEEYLATIISLLGDEDRKRNIREDMVRSVQFNTWSDVVTRWEEIIGEKEERGREQASSSSF